MPLSSEKVKVHHAEIALEVRPNAKRLESMARSPMELIELVSRLSYKSTASDGQ